MLHHGRIRRAAGEGGGLGIVPPLIKVIQTRGRVEFLGRQATFAERRGPHSCLRTCQGVAKGVGVDGGDMMPRPIGEAHNGAQVVVLIPEAITPRPSLHRPASETRHSPPTARGMPLHLPRPAGGEARTLMSEYTCRCHEELQPWALSENPQSS